MSYADKPLDADTRIARLESKVRILQDAFADLIDTLREQKIAVTRPLNFPTRPKASE